MRKITLLLFLVASSVSAQLVTKLSMNSDSFDRGSWHVVQWDYLEINDIAGSFDAPTTIIIPTGVTRGRCSIQVGLQIPLPHEGIWKAKLLIDDPLLKGSSLPSLPFVAQSQNDPTGLQLLSSQGPWFIISPDEVFSSGDRLTLEVFVDGIGSGSYVDSRSWLQCEWSLIILIDNFELGNLSKWR